MHEKLEKAKEVVRKNWKPFAIGAGLTIVTFVVTRRLTTYSVLIGAGKTVRISKRVADTGDFYKVFNVYTPGFKHLGPSWMVTCNETGKHFRSVNMAANKMGIPAARISEQLLGARHNAGGYTFTRIGIAV